MKVLILSFYYAPDLSAGSFRMTALVKSLVEVMPAGSTVDVVTTLPNRYHLFDVEAPAFERSGEVTIQRVALPRHRSGMRDQSLAFAAFARGATAITRGEKYDVVLATSSRLMTAVLGAWVAARVGAPLYLDIRDIFVETIHDIAPRSVGWAATLLFGWAERWAVGCAQRVNLVSPGFAPYFENRYPNRAFKYFINGIDDQFLCSPATAPKVEAVVGRVTVLYAGNLGEGQGLHGILPALALRGQGRLHFRVIGDGGRREALVEALLRVGVTNVELVPPLSRERLIEAYREADVLFLHLNDHEAVKRVLPSKIFEYAATGKPILAGVAGFAASFISREVTNAAIFRPCDAGDAIRALDSLALADSPRLEFRRRYSREQISRDMASDVVAVGQRG